MSSITTVWQKKDGYIFYNIDTGYFSASSNGWHGPDDFTIVGVYALVKPEDQNFQEFKAEIYNKIKNCKENLDEKVTQTDLFWIYLGNQNYFYITGKMGQEAPYDHYFLDSEEREKYYMSWDSKVMENLIDKELLRLSKDKNQDDLVEDSKRGYIDIFTDCFINNDIFTKELL